MLKRCVFLILIVVVTFSLSACGPTPSKTPTAPTTPESTPTEPSTPVPITSEKTSANDIEWLAKVIASEAGSVYDKGNWVRCTDKERAAVGWTVLNRVKSGTYGGTIEEVATAPGQYAYSQNPTPEIRELAEKLLAGQIPDPTGGATHFFSPISMPKEGESTTGFDVEGGLDEVSGITKRVYFPSWTKTYAWVGELDNVRSAYFMFYRPRATEVSRGYTEFYLLGPDGKPEGYPRNLLMGQEAKVIMCVVNHEYTAMDYKVEVTIDKEIVKVTDPISLADGEKWQQNLSFRPTRIGPGQQVEFHLYKMSEENPYSTLKLWIDVGTEAGLPVIPDYPVIKWKLELGGFTVSEPVIGPNGTIYVATEYMHPDKLYAVNPDGTVKWEFVAEGTLTYYNVGPDGTIYINMRDPHTFCALYPNGTKKWGSQSLSARAIAFAPDGIVYVAALGMVYALDPDGTKQWEFCIGKSPYGVAVAEDGTIYVLVGYPCPKLFAINSDGTKKWEFEFEKGMLYDPGPEISPDGTIYVLIEGEPRLYALNPNGTKKWEFAKFPASYALKGLAVGKDGSVYVGAMAGRQLYAIRNDGTQEWVSNLGGTKPALDTEGTILSSLYGIPRFYALNPDGSEKWEVSLEKYYEVYKKPAIGKDGTIYVITRGYTTADTELCAIGAGPIPELPRTIAVAHDFDDESLSHRWNTIQEGVSDATPGSTVIVHRGTYQENVVIDKTLSLRGEDMPTVDAGGHSSAITITAPFCTVSGLSVTGSGQSFKDNDAGIKVTSSNNILRSIVSELNTYGVCLEYSNYNTLSDIASNRNAHGIDLYLSTSNMLNGITVSENSYMGVAVGGPFNTLTHVTASKNGNAGISLNSEFNTLRNCVMTDNRYNFAIQGFWTGEAIQDIDTSNTVQGRPIYYLVDAHGRVIDSSTNAGYVALVNCTNITVKDLTLRDNFQGVVFVNTSDSRVENVTVDSNKFGVVLVGSLNGGSMNNVLTGIIAKNNLEYGIYLLHLTPGAQQEGSSYYLSNNTLRHNGFFNNGRNATDDCLGPELKSSNLWDRNYWSDYDGEDKDNDGVGDTPYQIPGKGEASDKHPLMQPKN